MAPFRRVEGTSASSEALGVLVPPGRRTLVIVRPRSLPWDLLPLDPLTIEGAGTPFWEVDRTQAPALAQRILEALQAVNGNRVDALAGREGYEVRAAVGSFVLVVCDRQPGQPYRPAVFETVAEAESAVERIAACLCPPAHTERELYINTLHFAR